MCAVLRIALAMACVLAAGCAGVKQAQQQEPVPSSSPVAPAPASVPPASPAPEAGPTPAVVEAPQARETPVQPSRIEPAIWGILEDPKKFTESNLMAGVTP